MEYVEGLVAAVPTRNKDEFSFNTPEKLLLCSKSMAQSDSLTAGAMMYQPVRLHRSRWR